MLQVCAATANMTLMCRLQTLKQVFDLTPTHSQNKRAANPTTGAGKSQKEAFRFDVAVLLPSEVFGYTVVSASCGEC